MAVVLRAVTPAEPEGRRPLEVHDCPTVSVVGTQEALVALCLLQWRLPTGNGMEGAKGWQRALLLQGEVTAP